VPPPDPVFLFTRKLNSLGLRYMVSGGVAAIFYGEPRLTNDVDIVLHLEGGDLDRFRAAFPEEEFYCPPREVLLVELGRERRGHFNLIHPSSGYKADVYVAGSDPFHAWGLARARAADLDGETVRFAPPEYVIVKKLQFFREGGSSKHPRDIQRMLVSLGESWDRTELIAQVKESGLEAEWAQVTGAAPA
jgi:hypothetical protein